MQIFSSKLKKLWILPFLLIGMAQEPSALTGGPDAGGYAFTDSNEVGGPIFGYVDVSGTGTVASLSDDSSTVVPIGFNFNFYGINYNTINIGSNGFLSFDSGFYTAFTDLFLPASGRGVPSTMLAPLWDDIFPRFGQVRYQTIGTAPNRQFIVQYRAPFYFNTGTNDFETILTEGSNDILFQYNYDAAARNRGASASVGIQRSGTSGLQYSYHQQTLSRGLAILFSTNIVVNTPPIANADIVQAMECTGASSANATLNGSASSDPDGDMLTYAWSWAGGSATGVSPTASFPIGTTPVTLTVDDGNGNLDTATTSVTVQDTTAPTVNTGADVTIEATSAAGAAYFAASHTTTTDTCCNSLTINTLPFGIYPLGATLVTVTATDCSNNTGSDQISVTVADNTVPVLTVPANVSVEANGDPLSSVTTGSATATDLFAVTVTSNAPAAGYPLGDTIVIWTATDVNGNVSTGMQTVTVADNTAPVLTLPTDIVGFEATGLQTVVAIGSATATDIFNPVSIASNAPATYPLGTTVVIWTATDANGNISTGTQSVNVVDTTAPVVSADLAPYSGGDSEEDGKSDSDEGRFKVQFTATDLVGVTSLTAELIINGYATPVTVSLNQIIEFEYEREKTQVEVEKGVLEIEAPSMLLRVTAKDSSGNTTVVDIQPRGLTADNDDESDTSDD